MKTVLFTQHRIFVCPASWKQVSRDEVSGKFTLTSGGLVAALASVQHELNFTWVGWPGCEVPLEEQTAVGQSLLAENSCHPVFLSKDLASKYYNGFSNGVLWPLFHYVPLQLNKVKRVYEFNNRSVTPWTCVCANLGQGGGEQKFDPGLWEAYKEANSMFADAILSISEESDLIWIHDYHLMMLPSELRKRRPCCKIAW